MPLSGVGQCRLGPRARVLKAKFDLSSEGGIQLKKNNAFSHLGKQDDDIFSSAFCENSEKLINVHLFALAANYYSLSNLGVCTPLEDVLEALKGDSEGATGIKPDEFMNNKKSHEVQVMSELVDSMANYCGIKQVIDIGSGKGYLSSFLSMQYNLKVYGIDSSSSNTNGAHERNKKLKKHWRAYQSRGRENLKNQSLENTNDRPVEREINCKTINEELLNNVSSLQNQDQVIIQDLVPSHGSTEMATPETDTETEADLLTGTQSHEARLSEEVLAVLNVLPADAVEDFSSSRNCRELSEEEKVQRKTASLKTKARKSNESNLYFPLTSCITAETELSDIITDLEDCMLVGLHTCGDLAANTLRIFTAKPEIKAVCSVGCCYHLLSEQFENQEECHDQVWGFPMCRYLKDKGWCCGRNARMSACLLPTESLFYRAVLQVIIEEVYGVTKSDRHVGKTFSKSSSFIDYVRRSLKKLELDDSKVSDSCIMDYYEKYKHRMNELEAFNMGLVWGLVLFNILVGDMGSGIKGISASLQMTPSCVVWSVCWREGMPSRGILRDGWAHENLTKLNKAEWKGLPLVWGNAKHKHRLGREWIEMSPHLNVKKDKGE
ncbi:hypothetical protein HGM15179_000184 [Zosterops borbonicus]|uniref:Methyltransferase domain-containing protein n=1 Tax=Zosterops borbonicus TaxID=364589 RepID=A0A8K1LVC4_9PASS|nr:hypothetical protein HGM15179_000184 [Zosterops borbonicus]